MKELTFLYNAFYSILRLGLLVEETLRRCVRNTTHFCTALTGLEGRSKVPTFFLLRLLASGAVLAPPAPVFFFPLFFWSLQA